MRSNTLQIDREALYQDVWAMTLQQVAKKLGTTVNAVVSACNQHQIPRPSATDRYAIQHGWTVERPPLPDLGKTAENPVALPAAPTPRPPAEPVQIAPKPAVPEQLVDPHDLVRDAIAASRRKDFPRPVLNVSAAKAAFPRAMRIMNTLIRRWEEDGGEVRIRKPSEHERVETQFCIGEDYVAMSLTERHDREVRPPKPNDYWKRPEVIHHPKGQLVLKCEGYYFGDDHLRRSWGDGARQRLEDLLDGALTNMKAVVASERQRRLDRECEGRQKASLDQNRARTKQRQDQREGMIKSLESDLQNWMHARRVRAYLRSMQRDVREGALRVTDEAAKDRWFAFIDWYADKLDPHAPKRPMPGIGSVGPQNTPVAQLEWTSRTRKVIESLGVPDTDALYRVDEQTVDARSKIGGPWSEICVVLETLGYDTSGRKYWR